MDSDEGSERVVVVELERAGSVYMYRGTNVIEILNNFMAKVGINYLEGSGPCEITIRIKKDVPSERRENVIEGRPPGLGGQPSFDDPPVEENEDNVIEIDSIYLNNVVTYSICRNYRTESYVANIKGIWKERDGGYHAIEIFAPYSVHIKNPITIRDYIAIINILFDVHPGKYSSMNEYIKHISLGKSFIEPIPEILDLVGLKTEDVKSFDAWSTVSWSEASYDAMLSLRSNHERSVAMRITFRQKSFSVVINL